MGNIQASRGCDFWMPSIPSTLQVKLSLLDMEELVLVIKLGQQRYKLGAAYQVWIRHVPVDEAEPVENEEDVRDPRKDSGRVSHRSRPPR